MSETPSMTSVLQERLSTFGAPPSSACRGLRAALAWLGNIRPTRPPVVLSFPCLLSLFLLGASFLTGRLAWGCLQWGMLVYLSFFFFVLIYSEAYLPVPVLPTETGRRERERLCCAAFIEQNSNHLCPGFPTDGYYSRFCRRTAFKRGKTLFLF